MKRHGSHALAVVRRFFPQVEEVNDADTNATITVTQRDVNTSKRKDHAGCALAVAAKRQFSATGMIVSRSTAYVIHRNVATRYYLPESIRKEIVSFDRGSEFAPGEYIMRNETKSRRLGPHTGGHGGQHGRSDKKIARAHLTTGIRVSLHHK